MEKGIRITRTGSNKNLGTRENMKLVMINDCASVGETLLKYMPATVEKQHIKRTRGTWSKTFGVAYEILKAKGDLYHANYLLQDCYIASILGKKPLVGYAMGSDVRAYSQHWMWGRIVRHNVKACDKILVSTPDLISIGKRYRKDIEYLPPPVDTELFHAKPLVSHSGKKRVLIASNVDWQGKGTDIAIRALSKMTNEVDVSIIAHGSDLKKTIDLASSLGLSLNVLPKVSHDQMNRYYWDADLVMDQFLCECPGMTSLEAITCGRPAVTNVSPIMPELEEFPLKNVNSAEKIVETIRETFTNPEILAKEQRYVAANHRIDVVVNKLMTIYDSILKR